MGCWSFFSQLFRGNKNQIHNQEPPPQVIKECFGFGDSIELPKTKQLRAQPKKNKGDRATNLIPSQEIHRNSLPSNIIQPITAKDTKSTPSHHQQQQKILADTISKSLRDMQDTVRNLNQELSKIMAD